MLVLNDLEKRLHDLELEAEQALKEVQDTKDLEEIRIKYFGEKSFLSESRRSMRELPKDQRPILGKLINQAQENIQSRFEILSKTFQEKELNEKLKNERIDVSLPALGLDLGHEHPLSQVTREITSIFRTMGFSLVDGPEIENTYYNFTALNTPEDHPARDEQDTFYTKLNPEVLLRSHTSSIQIRAMEKLKPPFRFMGYGRVYRNEEVNSRKMPFFHQLEIMAVDENMNFGHMKWVLNEFLNQFFGEQVRTRFRPDFFPFTEPSAEMDAECAFCKGQGCQTCGGRGWLELMGCGMVDPNVLEMAGIDPEIYSGFAAGLGLDRFTMLKYKIKDIRMMFNGDQRFVKQF
jgi:phenylalanyl-tRNA synthetase alpha chain